jgi:hypothetical protein
MTSPTLMKGGLEPRRRQVDLAGGHVAETTSSGCALLDDRQQRAGASYPSNGSCDRGIKPAHQDRVDEKPSGQHPDDDQTRHTDLVPENSFQLRPKARQMPAAAGFATTALPRRCSARNLRYWQLQWSAFGVEVGHGVVLPVHW